MSLDADIASIVVTESLGLVSLLVAFLFFRQLGRIRDIQKAFLSALNRGILSERGNGKCFSSEWILDNIVYKPRKLMNATPLLVATVAFLSAVFLYGALPRIAASLLRLGYAFVIAIIGMAILLWTDVFEASSYTNAIRKVATEQLDKEDQSYIELAREALEKAFLRFTSMGVAFALLGPFIPQIFNGVVYVFALYANIFFQISEASIEVLAAFGVVIVMILPAIMLFLPELMGRILIRKAKSLALKMLKRRVKQ